MITRLLSLVRTVRFLPLLGVLVALIPSESSALVRQNIYTDSFFASSIVCRNDPINNVDPLGLAAWADIVWDAMSTAEDFYGSRADKWFTQGLVAGLMTVTTPLAGALTAADLVTDQIGTFAGEVSAKDFKAKHIPVVGPVAENIGVATAAAVENPSLVNVSKAVGANLGGAELAFGGVMIKRGIQGNVPQEQSPPLAKTPFDRNAITEGFQDHHIISDKNPLTKSHELLDAADLSLQSRANKIFLPEDAALHPTRSIHFGKHTKAVSQNLADQMDAVLAFGRQNGWTKVQYDQALRALIGQERQMLRIGQRALNKNARLGAQ